MTTEIFIGELAREFGLSTQAIRYYENLGLLKKPKRNKSGYRVYSEEARTRLSLIIKTQNLGLALSEIKGILDFAGAKTESYMMLRNAMEANISHLEENINNFQIKYDTLTTKLEYLTILLEDRSDFNLQDSSLLNVINEIERLSYLHQENSEILQSNQLLQLYSQGERNFQGIKLVEAKLNGAILNNANLNNAELILGSLNEACFENTKLHKAYLTGAEMIGAYFHSAELNNSLILGANLTEANLTKANLMGCNFGGSCLQNANLEGANLCETMFIGADLRGANLTDAIILGTNFYEANLEGTILNIDE